LLASTTTALQPPNHAQKQSAHKREGGGRRCNTFAALLGSGRLAHKLVSRDLMRVFTAPSVNKQAGRAKAMVAAVYGEEKVARKRRWEERRGESSENL